MSAFRFLHRRSYSSFFSNKPGGGRYFNSHKPAKPVVAAAVNNAKDVVPDASTDSASSSPSPAVKPDDAPTPAPPRSSTLVSLTSNPAHPVIAPKDLQLHQFFSVHRPLLLLPDPPSILQSPPSSAPLFPTLTQRWEWHSELSDEVTGVGVPPNTSNANDAVDADAEAARQMTRALMMVRAGSTVSWESTLSHLGVVQAAEWDQEWEDILADSVKRKRRKKMKKHKLRKRRRLTRATRLRLK
ncbi:hypothetical protein FB45DRAFT_517834 [Roridomyces roridus]|uniref:Small ribosomal subunit protein mS38 n=1 Tax=Roridomyces roridus TaxID=1738132 RepID=A0AAD7FR33_9AGAR|nr:hypothetical protein FB45DRAFT_517834 [Roridomyces roridus]